MYLLYSTNQHGLLALWVHEKNSLLLTRGWQHTCTNNKTTHTPNVITHIQFTAFPVILIHVATWTIQTIQFFCIKSHILFSFLQYTVQYRVLGPSDMIVLLLFPRSWREFHTNTSHLFLIRDLTALELLQTVYEWEKQHDHQCCWVQVLTCVVGNPGNIWKTSRRIRISCCYY